MELNIQSKKENKLLFRTEVQGELNFEKATPSYAELIKELAAKLNVNEDLIAVQKIKTLFGSTSARFLANIYDSKENKERIEPKRKEKAISGGAQPVKAAA